jgi:hypothetical protein
VHKRGIAITTPTPTGGSTANPDFGTCPDPTLKGAIGLKPGAPTKFAFAANDQKTFDHPGALHPSVISIFICNSLRQRCGSNDAANELCAQAIIAGHDAGEAAGNKTTVGLNAVAAFNKAIGFPS